MSNFQLENAENKNKHKWLGGDVCLKCGIKRRIAYKSYYKRMTPCSISDELVEKNYMHKFKKEDIKKKKKLKHL